jgi:hypothetical protein
MSVYVMSLVWKAEFTSATKKIIALRLADFSNDEGNNIYPSVRRIAKDCGVNRSTVQRTLNMFESIGLLSVLKMGGVLNGKNVTTHYRINLEKLEQTANKKGPHSAAPSQQGGGSMQPGVAAKRSPGGPRGAAQTIIVKPSYQPPKERVRKSAPSTRDPSVQELHAVKAQFDAWWAVYPTGRKKGRGKAQIAFCEVVLGRRTLKASVHELLDAVKAYAATKPNPRFVPLPSTWLHEGRWLDDPKEAPADDHIDWRDEKARRDAEWKRALAELNGEEPVQS